MKWDLNARVRRSRLGQMCATVAAVLDNYADLLRKVNQDAEAEKLEARAQAIRAKHAQEIPQR